MSDINDARQELSITTPQAQPSLFENGAAPLDWEKEWQGMPEFRMGNTEPVQKITLSFKDWEDVKKFSELIGQSITRRTDSLWFPKAEAYTAPSNYRYVDES